MSKWSRDSDVVETEIWRALVIDAYHDDEDALDHIGREWA